MENLIKQFISDFQEREAEYYGNGASIVYNVKLYHTKQATKEDIENWCKDYDDLQVLPKEVQTKITNNFFNYAEQNTNCSIYSADQKQYNDASIKELIYDKFGISVETTFKGRSDGYYIIENNELNRIYDTCQDYKSLDELEEMELKENIKDSNKYIDFLNIHIERELNQMVHNFNLQVCENHFEDYIFNQVENYKENNYSLILNAI